MNEELKKCPFCGSDDEIDIVGIGNGRLTIFCTNKNCLMSNNNKLLVNFGESEKLIKMWNTRRTG